MIKAKGLLFILTLGVLLAVAYMGCKVMPAPTVAPTPMPTPLVAPRLWQQTEAPLGVEVLGAQWIKVEAPENRKMLAAIFRPEGAGPFPAVVFLHGTEGLREKHLVAVRALAQDGFVAVAGGWFGGHYNTGEEVGEMPTTQGDLIVWPDGPTLKLGTEPEAFRDVLALVTAVRTLPGVRPDRVGLIGHSRGSVAALTFASMGGNVQAVVAWAGYPPLGTITDLSAPVLILQGTENDEATLSEAQDYKNGLRSLGKPVEVRYYEGASHDLYLVSPWREEAVQHVRAFLQNNLAP